MSFVRHSCLFCYCRHGQVVLLLAPHYSHLRFSGNVVSPAQDNRLPLYTDISLLHFLGYFQIQITFLDMLKNLRESGWWETRAGDCGHGAGEREGRWTQGRDTHISWAPTVCHASQNAEHLTNDMSLDHRILPHQIRKPRLQRFL